MLLAGSVRCPSDSQDPDEVSVQLVAAHDGLPSGAAGRAAAMHEAPVLPATQAAVAADQRLEGRHVEGVGVDALLT